MTEIILILSGVFTADDMFEDDEHVKPLMSAFKIWQNLDQIVADENLFEKINILLLVQVNLILYWGISFYSCFLRNFMVDVYEIYLDFLGPILMFYFFVLVA